MTTTLNGNFGSKVVVRGAGFLNNEMDDFAIKPDHANQLGFWQCPKRRGTGQTHAFFHDTDHCYQRW